jgi:hypothetical protein
MTETFEQITLRVAGRHCISTALEDDDIVEFSRRLVAALGAQGPVDVNVIRLAVAITDLDNATSRIEKWMTNICGIGPVPEPWHIEQQCNRLRKIKTKHAVLLHEARKISKELKTANA